MAGRWLEEVSTERETGRSPCAQGYHGRAGGGLHNPSWKELLEKQVQGCVGSREPELTLSGREESREEILPGKHVKVCSEKPGPSRKVGVQRYCGTVLSGESQKGKERSSILGLF